MNVDRAELLRYLGWRGQETDEALLRKLDEAAGRCLEIAAPRSVVRRFALTPEFELEGTGLRLEGEDIRAHLAGCREVYLMAMTVGAGVEREQMRLAARSANEALLFDTAASCAVESYADDVCADLEASCGRRLTSRFSCGYGDFPLSAQRAICALLRTDARIGLCCDECFLLTPRKSITALAGITDRPAPARAGTGPGCGHKCGGCGKTDCAFRKTE